MRKAFIVVDMIYDFVADDGALTCGEPGQAIVDDIVQGIHETIQNGGYVYLCGDTHEPDDPEFQVWPVHAVKGTKGAEWVAPTQQAYEQYKDTGRIHIVNKTNMMRFSIRHSNNCWKSIKFLKWKTQESAHRSASI